MFRLLPLVGTSLAFVFLFGLPGIQAQNSTGLEQGNQTPAAQVSESRLGLFKTCKVEVEDTAAEQKNACEISIAFSCDGALPFLTSIPRLANIFGNANAEAQAEASDSQETETCVVTVDADCNCPCHPANSISAATEGMQVEIAACSDVCDKGCTSIHEHPPTATAGFEPGGRIVILKKDGVQCIKMGKSEGCACVALDSCSQSPGREVMPVGYNEPIRVATPNAAELLQGLMQARVENAKLEARLESLQQQSQMMEELIMLRARNEMLEQLAGLRAENLELQMRLEMAERRGQGTREPGKERSNRR